MDNRRARKISRLRSKWRYEKAACCQCPPFRLYSATIREERSPQSFGHSSPLRTRWRGTHRRKRMDGSDLKTSEKPSAPRFVIPSAAEGSFWQTHNGRRDTAGKRNTKTSIFIFTLTWITAGQGRFLDFARNDVTRKPPAANVPLFDYILQWIRLSLARKKELWRNEDSFLHSPFFYVLFHFW